MIRILLADDEQILRESLKLVLEQDEGIEVVGLAQNGMEAFEACAKLMPDIVLMDIFMPGYDGIEGTRLIKEKFKNIIVIILSTFNDVDNIKKALRYGADGYLLKEIKPGALIHAVKSKVSGISILSEDVMRKMASQLSPESQADGRKNAASEIKLLEKELEVLKVLADGRSNREIASMLYVSEGYVKNVISAMLEKLNLKDRTQLAVFAVRNNLV